MEIKMAKELSSRINPAEYEKSIYKFWLDKKLFHADEYSKKPAYSIVIPPPNVTGSLHMGHALDETIQDILARFKRMKGYEVLWMPGTDHAGIATQNVVEKIIASEGKTRYDLGREAFIERVWQQKKESGGTIISQLKALGSSCDWDRERFTMDEGLSRAVREVFYTLYKEDLIYRSNYMVNWCARCHTALSDIEVEFTEKDDFLYHLKYPIENSSEYLEIATTRPETYLGDTAVAVHPDDERYKHLVGKNVILPLINRKIPVIADNFVETEFGTGCVKITPAHDQNDFAAGIRHNLEKIVCIDENNKICGNFYKEFEGMDILTARKAVIEKFKELDLVVKIEPLKHNVGCCYRCNSVIEPRVSMQWFVKTKPLAEKAIEAVKTGKIKLIPKQWENTFFEWMNNIRDWCISRQIWWGHRIPAWHCADCSHTTVAKTDPDKCENCGSINIHQDEDVLDTWFSSSLWPFSTMGYPEKTDLLKKFYPTSTLVTGFDILFFWVARMMMMGIKFMDDVPFKDVYLHALVRDEKGQKMSKSKGNVIDPLIMIDKYGADAFRFTLAIFAAQGRDIKMNVDRVEGYRNFINKIWNASRFILMNLGDEISKIDENNLESVDKWILMKLQHTAKKASKAIDAYSINEAANELYQFFWMTFCDWYLELIKDRMFKGSEKEKEYALATAANVLEKSLIALHPYIPFVTEHIFQTLTNKETIMFEEYPDNLNYNFEKEEKGIDKVIEAVSLIRNIRGEYNISPATQLEIYINTDDSDALKLFQAEMLLIMKMGKAKSIKFNEKAPENCAKSVGNGFEIMVSLEGTINVEEEIARLEKEKKAVLKDVNLYGGKLQNEGYLAKAPAKVIEKDKKTYEEAKARLDKINEALDGLKK
jgi:valyl-tRNA synthetase